MKNKYIKLLLLVASFLILGIVTISSYGFYTAYVLGNDKISTNVITTGNMEIEFKDGNIIGSTEEIVPGSYIIKEFSVKNTGSLAINYNVYLNEVINRFNNKNDLVYELIGDGAKISEGICPYENSAIATNVLIGVGETHTYSLKIIFKETNVDQNENTGASFSAKISLEEDNNLLMTTIIKQHVENLTTLDSDYKIFDKYYYVVPKQKDYNLRYVGSNPNNYIYFNCDSANVDEMNDDTCEKWRIIAIYDGAIDSNYNQVSRVKIVKDEPLGNYSWDTSDSSVNNGRGINQWSNFDGYDGADLMRELNSDYLGVITVGTDGKWYNGANNKKEADMPSKMLNFDAQDMIEEVVWFLGNSQNAQFSGQNHEFYKYYGYERSGNFRKLCVYGDYCNDNVQRTGEWVGKVGLLNVSDYGFASSGNEIKSRLECSAVESNIFNENTDCFNNQWISIKKKWQWTLNTEEANSYATLVDYISNNGDVYCTNTAYAGLVRPTVYLKSDIKVVSGDGSLTNPFKLIK